MPANADGLESGASSKKSTRIFFSCRRATISSALSQSVGETSSPACESARKRVKKRLRGHQRVF